MQCMCVHVGAHFLLHTYVYILLLAQVTSTTECFQRLCWSCLLAVTSIPRTRGQGAWRKQQTELLQKLLLPLAGCAHRVAAPKGQPSLGAWTLLSCLTVISGVLPGLPRPTLPSQASTRPHTHVCIHIQHVIAVIISVTATAIAKSMCGASYVHVTFLRY